MQLKPLGDRVIVRPSKEEEVTKSGIVLPDTVEKEKKEQGEVVSVGNGEKITKLGYQARAFIALKVEPKDHAVLMAYLNGNANVNSLWRVNYGYTCVAEVVMPTVAHVEDFLQLLQANFSIVEKHVFNIIDDIKREEFVA